MVPTAKQGDQSIPLLVTNYHVVNGAQRAVIELVEQQGDEPATGRRVRAELDAATLTQHASSKLDIVAIPIGPLLNQLQNAQRPVFFRSVSPELVPTDSVLKDLAAMEDIVFIGYPAGLRDDKNANPLIRRGITATPVWNDFQGQPSFLIDAGVFPGSSGSPVFILNQGSYATRQSLVVGTRILFLGIITETMVSSAQKSEVFLGLGKVVRSTEVKDFIATIVKKLEKNS